MDTLIKVPGPSALNIDVWKMHAASALNLYRIVLSKMNFITDRGVRLLLSRSPNLKELTLMALPNITNDLWPDLKEKKKSKQKKMYLASGKVVEEQLKGNNLLFFRGCRFLDD